MVGDGTGVFYGATVHGGAGGEGAISCSHLSSSEIAQNPVLPAKKLLEPWPVTTLQ